MNDLTTGCIFCGNKDGFVDTVHLRTDEGIKPVKIKVCEQCIYTSHNLSEEVQQIIGDPIKWSNFCKNERS